MIKANNEYREARTIMRQWLVHQDQSPSDVIGLPEAVHQHISKRASLVIRRWSTVPTVEVVLQFKLMIITRLYIY
jgi:hypothetical protein